MEITHCLACGSKQIRTCLDLGIQTPVNRLMDHKEDLTEAYPLKLNYCLKCNHGQLSFAIPPEDLFSNYLYASGTSKTLTRYFSWFANEVYEEVNPESILEIGCNDGSLLREFKRFNINCVGVEPDKNLAKIAENSGFRIINDFWPKASLFTQKSFSLIIVMNVLAHGPDPLNFLLAAKSHLAPGGSIVIQVSHGDLLDTGQFDNIYHEHISYFTLSSMQALAQRAELYLTEAFRIDIHGESDVYVLSNKNQTNYLRFLRKPPYFLHMTPESKLCPRHIYETFNNKALNNLVDIDYQILAARKEEGKKIAFIGAAAKAIGVIQQAVFKPDFVFDEAPLKIGKWIPKIGLQIKSFDEVNLLPENTLFVISAWNFKEELVKKIKKIKQNPVDFMVYFPTIKLWKE